MQRSIVPSLVGCGGEQEKLETFSLGTVLAIVPAIVTGCHNRGAQSRRVQHLRYIFGDCAGESDKCHNSGALSRDLYRELCGSGDYARDSDTCHYRVSLSPAGAGLLIRGPTFW